MTAEAGARTGLLPREVVIGLALAGANGAALLAYVFLSLPMSFTVPFLALPAAGLLVGALLVGQRRYEQLHAFSRAVAVGAAAGLLATLVYDAIRPPLVYAMGRSYDPYRAIPIFGQLITGLAPGDPLALAVGWAYHFWNGVSFGVIYALVRPQGGWRSGLAWGLGLQLLMMAAYPRLLQARLDDPAFMGSGLIGHSFWGAVLGIAVRRWRAT